MRIRGYDEETEQLSDDLKTISGDIYDLTKVNGGEGISIFSDKEKTTYKSTYQILKEISSVWDELTDKQQASVMEKLGGKRGGQVLAGLLADFSEVERAMDEMENAAGSADAEMSVIEKSISFKLNNFKETWISFAQELLSRDDIGHVVDSATEASENLGKAINSLVPVLKTLMDVLSELFFMVGSIADKLGGATPIVAGGIAILTKYHSKISDIVDGFKKTASAIDKVRSLNLNLETQQVGDFNAFLDNGESFERVTNAVRGLNAAEAEQVLTSMGVEKAMQSRIMTEAGLISSMTAEDVAVRNLTKGQILERMARELGTQAEAEQLQGRMIEVGLLNEQGISTEQLTAANIKLLLSEGKLTEVEANQILTSLGLAGANTTQAGSLTGLTTALIANTKARIKNTLATMAAHPVLTLLAAAVAAVTVAIIANAEAEKKQAERLQEIKDKAEEAKSAISSLRNELRSNIKTVNEISESYAKLAQNVDNLGKVSQSSGALSNEDYEKFLEYSNQLADIFPQLIKGYDDNGNAILDLAGSFDTITASLDALLQKEKELKNFEIGENLAEAWTGYDTERKADEKSLDELKERYKYVTQLYESYKSGRMFENDLYADDAWHDYLSADNEFWDFSDKLISQFGGDYYDLSKEQLDDFYNQIKKYSNTISQQISQTESKIKTDTTSIGSLISSWLSTDIDYNELSEDMQNVVKDIFSDNTWLDILKQSGEEIDTSDWSFIQTWFDHNLMDQLERIRNENIQKQIAEALAGNLSSADLKSLQDLIQTVYKFDENNPLMIYLQTKFVEQKENEDSIEQAIINSIGTKKVHSVYGINGAEIVETIDVDEAQQEAIDYLRQNLDPSEWNEYKSWAVEQGEKVGEIYLEGGGEGVLKAFRKRNVTGAESKISLANFLKSEEYSNSENTLDKFQSKLEKLTGTLTSIRTGTFTDADKLALFEEFPELIDNADNLEGAIKNLIDDGLDQLDKSLSNTEGAEETRKALWNVYSTALKATDALRQLNDENKKLAHMQGKANSGLSMLKDIYADVKDAKDEGGEPFDWSSILNNADFTKEFGDLKSYNDFIKIISENPTNLKKTQEAFDQLLTEYLKASDIFKDISKENKKGIINYLDDMGVGNAKELVNEYLSDMTKYEKNIKKIGKQVAKSSKEISKQVNKNTKNIYDTNAAKKQASVLQKSAQEQSTKEILKNTLGLDDNTAALIANETANIDLENAEAGVIKEITSTIDLYMEQAGASDVAIASMRNLIAEQKIFSNMDLNISEKISALKSLAAAYGKTLASVEAYNAYEKAISEGKYVGDTESARKAAMMMYENAEKEWREKIYEDAKESSLSSVKAKEDGGNGKDKSSKDKNLIDWIERRINIINAAIDTLEAEYENVNSVKKKNSILSDEVENAERLLKTYKQAEDYYMNYFVRKVNKYQKKNIGLTMDLVQKVIDGEIEVQDFAKNENLYNALTDLESWWDKVNESAKGYAETLTLITEKEQKAFDNINEKYDKRREKIDTRNSLLEARYGNLSETNLSAKNTNLDKQVLKDYKTNEQYQKELQRVTNRQKQNRKSLRENLAKETSTPSGVIKKIKSLMKQGKRIPADLINQLNNEATIADVLAYNVGISEVKEARNNYKQNTQETISEIVSENKEQIDNINAYYDLLQEDIDDTQTKQDAKAANTVAVRKQNSFVDKSTANTESGVKIAKKRLNKIKSATKKDKQALEKELDKSLLSDSDIATIKSCTESGDKIPDEILNKVTNSTLYARLMVYNNDIEALEAAQLDYDVKSEELITTRRQNAKVKFDNITTGYEKVLGTLQHSLSDVDNEITKVEAKGKKIDATFYKTQMNLYDKQNQLLGEELQKAQNELETALTNGDVQVGTQEYFEMLDAIQNVENEQANVLSNIKAAKDAITTIADDIQSKIVETVHGLVSEIELITELLGENLTDDKIGGFTEAGLAALSNAQAVAMAYKTTQEETKDLLDSMQKAYEKKTLTFVDSNGVERQYSSLDELKEAIESVQDAYEDETKSFYSSTKEITDLMKERYQSEIAYINDLIDKKKDLLNAEKDLYDYSKQIADQTKNINSLRKQIAALSGDTSLEGQARRQKIETQLKEANENLQDTEYEHYISAQQTMLDNLSAEYQEFVDEHLKETDELLVEANKLINNSSAVIENAITTQTEKYGYEISSELLNLLDEASKISEQMDFSLLYDSLDDHTATLNTSITNISTEIKGGFESLKTSMDGYFDTLNEAYKAVVGSKSAESTNTNNSSDIETETKQSTSESNPKSKTNERAILANEITQILRSGSAFDSSKNYGEFYSILKQNGFTNITAAQMAEIANLLTGDKKYTAKMFKSDSTNYKKYRAALIKKLAEMGLLPHITADQKKWYTTNALQGFSSGGIVKGYSDAIKANGDKVLISARPGEGLLTEEQVKVFQKLALGQTMKSLNMFADAITGMDKRTLENITNSNIGATNIDNSGIEFNFVLENVSNADDVMREIQNNSKYQKVLQDLTVNQLSGRSARLSANRYKI